MPSSGFSSLFSAFDARSRDDPDPGTPSAEFAYMEVAREFPRILDSSRVDGGVLRLLTDPGGKLGEWRGGGRFGDDAARIHSRRGKYAPLRDLPFLIQNEVESDPDYVYRATIAAPRDVSWSAASALAGRPFRTGIKFLTDLPGELNEWLSDVDGRGNDLRAFAEGQSRDSVGYGNGYVRVDFSRELERPILKWIDADAVPRVVERADGKVQRMHVHNVANDPPPRDRPWEFGKERHQIIVYERGSGDDLDPPEFRFASFQVFDAENDSGTEFSKQPSIVEDAEGSGITRVSLRPHVEIPIVAWPTGILRRNHMVLPPLLSAFKLEYLLFQLYSNVEFSGISSTQILRFAKGISPREIEDFVKQGSKVFYATTSPEAEMKFLAPAGTAIDAGMTVIEAVHRALDVATLSPLMRRQSSGPEERKFAQATGMGHVRSAAQLFAFQRQVSIAKTVATMGVHLNGERPTDVQVLLDHDFGVTEQSQEAAEVKANLYLRDRKMSPYDFFVEMQRHGIISENADLDRLVSYAQDEEMQRLEVRRGTTLAKIFWEMRKKGELTREGMWELFEHHKLIPRQDGPTIKTYSKDGQPEEREVPATFVVEDEIARMKLIESQAEELEVDEAEEEPEEDDGQDGEEA